MVKTQFEKGVKCLKTDNDTEFFNSEVDNLLKEHGILQQSSCVYSLQQNETVEKRHRSILDIARALRFQAFVPLKS